MPQPSVVARDAQPPANPPGRTDRQAASLSPRGRVECGGGAEHLLTLRQGCVVHDVVDTGRGAEGRRRSTRTIQSPESERDGLTTARRKVAE